MIPELSISLVRYSRLQRFISLHEGITRLYLWKRPEGDRLIFNYLRDEVLEGGANIITSLYRY
jgi:phage-related protein